MLNKFRKLITFFLSELNYQIELARHAKKLPILSAQDQLIVDACRQEGAFSTSLEHFGIPSTDEMLEVAQRHFATMDRVLTDRRAKGEQLGTVDSPAYPTIFTVTDLPEFSQWACEQRLLNIVENYIGLPVVFQGVHLRQDFANEKPVTTELWHRDLEDRRVIKVFVYLTDVNEENGPFEYIPKSKASPLMWWWINLKIAIRTRQRPHELGINDDEMNALVPRLLWKRCEGPAGMVVFSDAVALFHHGKSRTQGRKSLFFVYTAANPRGAEHCKQYSDRTFARPDQMLSQA